MRSLMERLLMGLVCGALAVTPYAYGMPDEDKKQERKAGTETITGVIDQSAGIFVISTEDRIRPIASLRGDGFKDTNFARFVGLKVRVKGEMTGSGEGKTFVVRSLDDIEKIGPTKTK